MYGICDECEQDTPREQHLTSCRYHPENYSEEEPEPEAEPIDFDALYGEPEGYFDTYEEQMQ